MFDWLDKHIGVPALIIFVGALISAIVAFLPSKKVYKRTFVFCGGIFIALGGIWASTQSKAWEGILSQKTDEIATANKKIASKSEEIAALYQQLAIKSEEISKLNQKVLQSVTGGSSYPYVFPTFIQEGGRTVVILVVTSGDTDRKGRVSTGEALLVPCGNTRSSGKPYKLHDEVG